MEDLPFQPLQKRVVVVDDDTGMRRALRMLLERRGYAVDECETGDELLDHLQTHPEVPPYCVILDLHLEGMSGLEARRRMHNPDFPVILITGDTRAGGAVEEGLFEAVIYKPLDWLDLCSRLQGLQAPQQGCSQ